MIGGIGLAFIFTLDSSDALLKGASNDNEDLATLDIGYDDETQVTYKAFAALAPIPGCPPSDRELFFFILEVDADGGMVEIKSGLESKSFLSGDNRSDVLHVIAVIACNLIKKRDIKILVINTVETHLPPKALLKYERICAVIGALGYTWAKVDSFHGAEQWQIKKI